MNTEIHGFLDFPSDFFKYKLLKKPQRKLQYLFKKDMTNYS